MKCSEPHRASDPKAEVSALILARDPINAMEHDLSHLPEYHATDFNIDGGLRRTLAPAAVADRRLLLCGGSTVICSDVADHETLPSHLQTFLNAEMVPIRVENWGRWGSTVENRAFYLRRVARPRAGDLVVIYFGVNDTGYRLYNHARYPTNGSARKILAMTMRLLRASSHRARGFRPILRLFVILPLSGLLAVMTVFVTLKALRREYQHWDSLGVGFLAVLQPNLVDYSQRHGLRDDRVPRSLELSIMNRCAYTLYRRASKLARFKSVIVDASRRLDDSLDRYLDWSHLDSRGNKLIASAIFQDPDFSALQLLPIGTSSSDPA
jgi:hypothetical protein